MINMNRKVFMISIGAAGLIVSLISASQFAAAPGGEEPPIGFAFFVQIDDETLSGVIKVSGISAEIEVLGDKHERDDHERDNDEPAVKLAGETTYSNLVVSRGISTDTSLFDWFEQSQSGAVKKTVSVIVTDLTLEPIARYDFQNAWPCKYGLEKLDATSTDAIIETVEICHEGMDRVL